MFNFIWFLYKFLIKNCGLAAYICINLVKLKSNTVMLNSKTSSSTANTSAAFMKFNKTNSRKINEANCLSVLMHW